jgi:hypothetical protein
MQVIENPIELFAISAIEADPLRRIAPPTHQATFKMALEVEHKIKLFRAHAGKKSQKLFPASLAFEYDNSIDSWIPLHQRKTCRLDRPNNPGLRKTSPQ